MIYMMSHISYVLSLMLTLLTSYDTTTSQIVGQWMPTTNSIAKENLLAEALQKENDSLKVKLCFTEILTIEQQIVNGINFLYHVRGCETTSPGHCNSGVCSDEKKFDVQLFVQPWTDIVRVMSVVNVQ
ncbi:hypothetical protein Plhal304r1_c019g0069851 [Plasmopara halstedii]